VTISSPYMRRASRSRLEQTLVICAEQVARRVLFVTGPGNPFGDSGIESELEAIRAQLAKMATESDPARVQAELGAVRDALLRLSQDNEEVRLRLRAALGLRVDDSTE
jgi:hypothetical protein